MLQNVENVYGQQYVQRHGNDLYTPSTFLVNNQQHKIGISVDSLLAYLAYLKSQLSKNIEGRKLLIILINNCIYSIRKLMCSIDNW